MVFVGSKLGDSQLIRVCLTLNFGNTVDCMHLDVHNVTWCILSVIQDIVLSVNEVIYNSFL